MVISETNGGLGVSDSAILQVVCVFGGLFLGWPMVKCGDHLVMASVK